MASSAYVLDVEVSHPYRVHIGTFLLEQVGAITHGACPSAERALIITDDIVGPLYAAPVKDGLEEAGLACAIATVKPGEQSKRAEMHAALLERTAAEGLTRSDVIVALGGGVIGDLAGYVAATYMRGVDYVQVPTTLLAMVDSSIGGKTAIDLEGGKNLAGAFWHPSAVIADVGCLGTLPDEQFADGCGEVVKHAMIADADLFAELEQTPLTPALLKSDLARATNLIARNVDIKRAVVEADEREQGIRRILNFGHSIGHALEAAEGYRLGHGTCVAIGMVAIASSCVTAELCPEDVPERLVALLDAHGLHLDFTATPSEVFAAAQADKKRSGETIDLIVPRAIGAAAVAHTPMGEFRKIIEVGLACAHALADELVGSDPDQPTQED